MKPDYVIKKSAWSVIRPWHILLFFLIVPLIIMIVKIINIKDDKIEIYNNKIVQKSGIFNKKEKTTILTAVLSVDVYQSFWGRIFNYGNVSVDVVGQWDINTKGVKDPQKLKQYLERYIANARTMRQYITN